MGSLVTDAGRRGGGEQGDRQRQRGEPENQRLHGEVLLEGESGSRRAGEEGDRHRHRDEA